jgi:adenylyltransferase/sulfurtransferase
MATVILPAPLRPFAAGRKEVDVTGQTVADALSDLMQQHPGLRQHVFDEQGELRAFVHLFVDGEELENAAHNPHPLEAETRLTLLPLHRGRLSASW